MSKGEERWRQGDLISVAEIGLAAIKAPPHTYIYNAVKESALMQQPVPLSLSLSHTHTQRKDYQSLILL